MLAGREAAGIGSSFGNTLACTRKFSNEPKAIHDLIDYSGCHHFIHSFSPRQKYFF